MESKDFSTSDTIIAQEIRDNLDRVISRGDFILGEDVTEFEQEVADYLGVKHAVGINSGTDAFRIALSLLRLEKGDEVIVPPFCFVSDAAAVVMEGGTPVFVDIDPDTFNIDLDRIEEKITARTRAIIPAHMYGLPVDMVSLMKLAVEYNIVVIEDACQAFGATLNGQKAGSFGQFAGFSFYPTKPVGSYGDAGLITTNSDEQNEKIRMVRNHGSRKKYYHDFIGFSSRMDTLQAAVLRVQLKYFDSRLNRLKKLHNLYDEILKDQDYIRTPVQKEHIQRGFTHYTISTSERDSLYQFLQSRDIGCGIYYPLSVHLQKAFAFLGYKDGDFPRSERAQKEVLSLPLDMNVNDEIVERTCKVIKEYFQKKS